MNQLRALVRPVVTLMFAVSICAGFFLGKIPQDAFLPMAGMVLSFWFQSRSNSDSGNREQN